MKTILELVFLDGVNKFFKLRIADPRPELEEMQVAGAGAEIIDQDVFISNNTSLVSLVSARIIETRIEVMEF